MAVTTTFDLEGLTQLKRRVEVLANTEGKVGYFTDPLAHKAEIHEFGAVLKNGGIIPPRPFIRTATEDHEVNLEQEMRIEATSYLLGTSKKMDLMPTLKRLRGAIAVQIATIAAIGGNAESTIKKKGGRDTPLVDTGEMRDGVQIKTKGRIT